MQVGDTDKLPVKVNFGTSSIEEDTNRGNARY